MSVPQLWQLSCRGTHSDTTARGTASRSTFILLPVKRTVTPRRTDSTGLSAPPGAWAPEDIRASEAVTTASNCGKRVRCQRVHHHFAAPNAPQRRPRRCSAAHWRCRIFASCRTSHAWQQAEKNNNSKFDELLPGAAVTLTQRPGRTRAVLSSQLTDTSALTRGPRDVHVSKFGGPFPARHGLGCRWPEPVVPAGLAAQAGRGGERKRECGVCRRCVPP